MVLTINKEPQPSGYYYWSQMVWFTDGNGAYFGLQTTSIGKLAIFSVWNATACEPYINSFCVRFTNEGSGYSVRLKYNWQQGHKYSLRIWYLNNLWWGFYITDRTTGIETYVGKLKAPTSAFIRSFALFSEYYGTVNSCYDVPRAKVTFSDFRANNRSYTAKFAVKSLNLQCKNMNIYASDDKLITETGRNTTQN